MQRLGEILLDDGDDGDDGDDSDDGDDCDDEEEEEEEDATLRSRCRRENLDEFCVIVALDSVGVCSSRVDAGEPLALRLFFGGSSPHGSARDCSSPVPNL